eukprot:2438620-Amphidinium_carterae.1
MQNSDSDWAGCPTNTTCQTTTYSFYRNSTCHNSTQHHQTHRFHIRKALSQRAGMNNKRNTYKLIQLKYLWI